MAQGPIDAFEKRLRYDRTTRDGKPLVETANWHLCLGDAAAEVTAARALMRRDCREIMDRDRRDELPTLDDRACYRRNQDCIVTLIVLACS